ncbi:MULTISPECIES: putative quinol monooxygenase [unclassified Ruegeria]|uniref:putative quinol monooxygenase n=1 Tax=unclassified Ruegeria TaxID=2625375 RepID=UPI001ADC1C23|nr:MULTISPECIES: putative quinol monooxygenase [unclassified Ruegeria]MBO9410646.1 antibiotic biosynthesis monooxygenase [Ruegeria sp. R8_1]MBO9414135.1 antibiotic biosynthesis monooxygenase [Ruegeria sp. R8_2]
MLVVTGTVEVTPEGVERAAKAAQEMVAETVKEQGCNVYEFSQVLGHSNRFRVYEEWESQAALEAHFATPHMEVFRAVLGEVGVISNDICRIVGGEKQPLR